MHFNSPFHRSLVWPDLKWSSGRLFTILDLLCFKNLPLVMVYIKMILQLNVVSFHPSWINLKAFCLLFNFKTTRHLSCTQFRLNNIIRILSMRFGVIRHSISLFALLLFPSGTAHVSTFFRHIFCATSNSYTDTKSYSPSKGLVLRWENISVLITRSISSFVGSWQ